MLFSALGQSMKNEYLCIYSMICLSFLLVHDRMHTQTTEAFSLHLRLCINRDSQLPDVKEEFLSGATVLYGDVTNKESIQVRLSAS